MARPVNVLSAMHLEEVEVGADAGLKHSADDEAITTNEARNDSREVETVQPDGQADRSRTYLRGKRRQVDVTSGTKKAQLASLAVRADPQLTKIMHIILSLSMARPTSFTERITHLFVSYMSIDKKNCVGLSEAPCGGKAKIENTLSGEIRRGTILSKDNPPKKAGSNDARAYERS